MPDVAPELDLRIGRGSTLPGTFEIKSVPLALFPKAQIANTS